MTTLYDTLRVEYGRCPPDCRLCEEACAKEKGEPGVLMSRIKTVHSPQVNFHGVMTCIQCSQPACQQVCPAGAVEKSPIDGVVQIDEDKCVGCGLCTLACPYGGIYYNPTTGKYFKCDMCRGDPKCVSACPYGVLSYVENSTITDYFQTEDMLSRGTSLCAGCPAEVALRLTLRVLGRNTILFGAPGCLTTTIVGQETMVGSELPAAACLLNNVASVMTGVRRYYKHIDRDVNLVAFVGDGATADIGFQALSGAVERRENFIYICYDNEGYMITGIQRSGTTPYRAWTTTSPVGEMAHGKEEPSKNMPLLMVFNGASYVATATIALLKDYIQKLEKAMKVKDGVAYIHLYSPCPTGWRAPQDSAIQISRLAVETNYLPLWEAEHGRIRLTQEVSNPRPVSELTSLMGKFSHLNKEEVAEFQRGVDDSLAGLKALASISG